MRTLCLALLPLSAFAAGPLIVGGRGGVPFNTNDTVANALGSSLSSSQPFVIGPTAGVRLPLGFSVEGDALYRRQNFGIGQFGGFTAASTTASSWEFPVMLRFSPGHGPIAPVFGAGVTVRHLNQFSAVPGFLFEGSTSPNTVGFVAGAGLNFRLGPVQVTPELRYMHWGGDSFSQSIADFLPLNRNEASFLVGITF